VEKYGTARKATDDIIVWRMRIAWWMNMATDPHPEFVIIALSRQKQLGECALTLLFTYAVCLFYISVSNSIRRASFLYNTM
jgi:hypothetical protein